MGVEFKVSPDELVAAAGQIREHAGEIESHGATLGGKTAAPVGRGAIGEVVETAVRRGIHIVEHGITQAVARFHHLTAEGLEKVAAETKRMDHAVGTSFHDLEHGPSALTTGTDRMVTPRHVGEEGDKVPKESLRSKQQAEHERQAKAAGTNAKIDQQLGKVNPKFDRSKSAYSENCTGVVQAYEMQRRGTDVAAGPLDKHLRKDEGGPGGRPLSVIENAWGGKFTAGSRTDIEKAFSQEGSRGVVYIRWKGGTAHVFSVENVAGRVRFVDGQPKPPVVDASHYFNMGSVTKYLRTDHLPTPPGSATAPYLEGP
jgi:hypothetical protein